MCLLRNSFTDAYSRSQTINVVTLGSIIMYGSFLKTWNSWHRRDITTPELSFFIRNPLPLRRMDTAGKSHDTVSIVDGQQRLTTVVILLDGICRSLSTLSEEAKTLALGIRTNFIATTEVNGQPLHKLTLNGDASLFFENTILSETPSVEGPTITSERRLLAAKKTVHEYLSLHPIVDKKERAKWLQALYMKVSTQLRFSLYEVGR